MSSAPGVTSVARPGHGIVRLLLLAFWCFVLWGSLLVLSTLWAVLFDGAQAFERVARLSPLNQICAAGALLAWGLVVWGLLAQRRVADEGGDAA
jgi:hypothetical protein